MRKFVEELALESANAEGIAQRTTVRIEMGIAEALRVLSDARKTTGARWSLHHLDCRNISVTIVEQIEATLECLSLTVTEDEALIMGILEDSDGMPKIVKTDSFWLYELEEFAGRIVTAETV